MATYEVTCEFVVSRTVWVDARHGLEAKELAKAEISEREGIPSDEVGVVDAQREMVTHPYQFNLWREDQDDKQADGRYTRRSIPEGFRGLMVKQLRRRTMIKEFWNKMVGKRKSNKKLSRPEQILSELDRGQGTARQVSDRSGIKLSIVRTNLSTLHKKHLIRATGTTVPSGYSEENVWEVVK